MPVLHRSLRDGRDPHPPTVSRRKRRSSCDMTENQAHLKSACNGDRNVKLSPGPLFLRSECFNVCASVRRSNSCRTAGQIRN